MVKYLHAKAWSFPLLAILFSLLGATSLASAADLIENIGEGRINWSQGVLTANGIGAPPKDVKNPAQVRAMTQRAAITVARRNLLEVLKGVRVDSSTTVENFIVTSDLIKTQVSGVLQGSQVIQTKYFSDGSVEVTVGIHIPGELASALMPPSLFLLNPAPPPPSSQVKAPEKPAAGIPPVIKEQSVPAENVTAKEASGGAMTAPSAPPPPVEKEKGKEEVREKVEPSPSVEKEEVESAAGKAKGAAVSAQEKGPELTTPTPPPAPPRSEEPEVPPQPAPPLAKAEERKPAASEEKASSEAKAPPPPPSAPLVATGLVVDARGLGLKPALLPRIIDEGGGEIYSSRQVSRQSAVEQGLVGYAKDVAAAQRNVRVTDKPLLVKGVKAVGKEKTDVMIPDSDAATVVAAASASNFLEKSRVIIVYD